MYYVWINNGNLYVVAWSAGNSCQLTPKSLLLFYSCILSFICFIPVETIPFKIHFHFSISSVPTLFSTDHSSLSSVTSLFLLWATFYNCYTSSLTFSFICYHSQHSLISYHGWPSLTHCSHHYAPMTCISIIAHLPPLPHSCSSSLPLTTFIFLTTSISFTHSSIDI